MVENGFGNCSHGTLKLAVLQKEIDETNFFLLGVINSGKLWSKMSVQSTTRFPEIRETWVI